MDDPPGRVNIVDLTGDDGNRESHDSRPARATVYPSAGVLDSARSSDRGVSVSGHDRGVSVSGHAGEPSSQGRRLRCNSNMQSMRALEQMMETRSSEESTTSLPPPDGMPKWQQVANRIARHPDFELVVVTLVMVNCISLALYAPTQGRDYPLNRITVRVGAIPHLSEFETQSLQPVCSSGQFYGLPTRVLQTRPSTLLSQWRLWCASWHWAHSKSTCHQRGTLSMPSSSRLGM